MKSVKKGEENSLQEQLSKKVSQPIILRYCRLLFAFVKSDEERDFYLDRHEGFLIYVDIKKSEKALEKLFKEMEKDSTRYLLIPKLTFYEIRKLMENFVNEKVFDIDTKEKLFDIINGKDARERFLEFIYESEYEVEKWQMYYQERLRVHIIEWLRNHNLLFIFEEDLDIGFGELFQIKNLSKENQIPKELQEKRKYLLNKAKSYYANDALYPKPKRGRPPKHGDKIKAETKFSFDTYSGVPEAIHPFLFIPDTTSLQLTTFSSKYESEEDLMTHVKPKSDHRDITSQLETLSQRVESMREQQ